MEKPSPFTLIAYMSFLSAMVCLWIHCTATGPVPGLFVGKPRPLEMTPGPAQIADKLIHLRDYHYIPFELFWLDWQADPRQGGPYTLS